MLGGAQPLWRSSPGASMSVYQTAFWDGYVTASPEPGVRVHVHMLTHESSKLKIISFPSF